MRYYLDLLNEGVETAAEKALIVQFPQHTADIKENFKWAKKLFPRQDFINWYKHQLIGLYNKTVSFDDFMDFTNYCDSHLDKNIPKIASFRFTNPNAPISEIIQIFQNITKEYQATQDKLRGVPIQKGDYTLFEFYNDKDELEYAWWYIDRAYCSEEGRSGQHCGNVIGQTRTNQKILSFRNNKNQVLMTFILEPDYTLGEMKAKGNQKPNPKYHPYIMTLLLSPDKLPKEFHLNVRSSNRPITIKGISGEGYLPEMNFSIFDLDYKNLHYIDENKPNLISSQLKITPFEIIYCDKETKQKYLHEIPDYLHPVVEHPNIIDNWINAANTVPEIIIHVPHAMWDSFPLYEQTLINTISNNHVLLLRAPNVISKNIDLLKKIVTHNPYTIKAVNPNLKKYEDLCKIAVSKNVKAITYIPKSLRTYEICKIVVSKSPNDIRKAPTTLPQYEELCKLAILTSKTAFNYIDKEYLTQELCDYYFFELNGDFNKIPSKFQSKEISIQAISKNPNLITKFGMKSNPHFSELAQLAVTNNLNLITKITSDYQTQVNLLKIALKTKPRDLSKVFAGWFDDSHKLAMLIDINPTYVKYISPRTKLRDKRYLYNRAITKGYPKNQVPHELELTTTESLQRIKTLAGL